MTVFERIKKTADDRGLTLTQVSAKAGLGEKTIYKWKYNDPSAPRLQAVADVLNVSVDYLLGHRLSNFPNRLRELRSQASLTQNEVAEKVNVSKAGYSALETGRRTPSAETLSNLANLFGVSIEYLLGNEKAPTSTEGSATDFASQVGGLFRAVVKEKELDTDEQQDLKDDFEAYLKMRADLLKKRNQKHEGE